uniref:Protein kinase domain-containing protein n=1 Tax=Takifugu rubripes TaxID=31033 RepID=A0A674NHG1_TAKRU
ESRAAGRGGTTDEDKPRRTSCFPDSAYAVVMKCHNFRLNKLEAVKMYKQHNNIMGVAIMEIDILERLRCLYSYRCNIIRWDGYFFTQSSICLSFELLDIDLGRYVSGRSRTRCLTVAEVRPILHQVTTALFHLKSLGIIHCDVKPENILCVDRRQQPLQVKLADFGLARVAYNFNPAIPAQTLCYRAPEVLVGRNYNEAIDMWSLGATAAGLVLGSPLYLVKNEYDALRAIIKTQGQLSDQLLDQGSLTEYYFVKNANSSQKWTLQTREVHERQTGCRPVQKLITLNKMLHLDPKERVEPLQALLHGFFTEDTPSDYLIRPAPVSSATHRRSLLPLSASPPFSSAPPLVRLDWPPADLWTRSF